jgi:small subunit ribosomal protein S17
LSATKWIKQLLLLLLTDIHIPLIKKIVSRTTRYKAHDPGNKCVLGDRVKIRETRPLSAHKRWAIEEILNKTSQTKEVKK